jgi:1-acyl-sn-glycerol-3-phosphate acyltransferase
MQTSTVIMLGIITLLVIGYFWLMRKLDDANIASWGNKTANRFDGLNRLFMHKYHRLPMVSFNLPVEGPAIVVANHISGLDAFMLLASSSRPLHFLIAAEQYNRYGFRWLFDLSGCIPVEKATRPERALRAALRALNEGKVIALFPFGRMHLDSEEPIKIKGGVAVLAERSGAIIYPARIEGAAVKKEVMPAVIKRGYPKLFPLEPIRIEENETPREMLSRLSEALSSPIEEAT